MRLYLNEQTNTNHYSNMKYFTLALLAFLIASNSFGQDNPKTQKFELGVGINHLLSKNEVEPKPGFGISIKRIWFSEKTINIVSGLLFEKTKYLDDYDQCGHYCYYKDMKFNVFSFSIPLMLRVNAGKKYKLFFETGPALEITPLKWGKGIEVLDPPLSTATESEISGDFEHDITGFGMNIGIGISFPVKNYRFVLASTYHNSIQSIIEDQQNELTEYFTVKLGISW